MEPSMEPDFTNDDQLWSDLVDVPVPPIGRVARAISFDGQPLPAPPLGQAPYTEDLTAEMDRYLASPYELNRDAFLLFLNGFKVPTTPAALARFILARRYQYAGDSTFVADLYAQTGATEAGVAAHRARIANRPRHVAQAAKGPMAPFLVDPLLAGGPPMHPDLTNITVGPGQGPGLVRQYDLTSFPDMLENRAMRARIRANPERFQQTMRSAETGVGGGQPDLRWEPWYRRIGQNMPMVAAAMDW